jgi:deoxyribodipyrimidine photo-lyase
VRSDSSFGASRIRNLNDRDLRSDGAYVLYWMTSPRRLSWNFALDRARELAAATRNAVAGIFCVLGRYDRAWGPEREIFRKVRYMTSRNTARRVRVKQYIDRYRSARELD